MTTVATVGTRTSESSGLRAAARVLASGGIVAFPTETFYGLGVAALHAPAVRRLFAVKRRPATKPVLVLVSSLEMAESLVEDVPPAARTLIARHWPGPLTMVLRARATIPPELTAGTGTIGVRVPGLPLAVDLVRAFGAPITAPSANKSGAQPPVTAQEVLDTFDGEIDLVLDGGATPGGPSSTVVDVTVDPPVVVRRGAIPL